MTCCPFCDQHLAEIRELRSELEGQRIVLQHVTDEMKRFKRLCAMKDRIIVVADEALERYSEVFDR